MRHAWHYQVLEMDPHRNSVTGVVTEITINRYYEEWYVGWIEGIYGKVIRRDDLR